MTLNYEILQFIQHLESIEVKFTHADLPNALAQVFVRLPKGLNGLFLGGSRLEAAILAQAPTREWFEEQEAKLSGTTEAIQKLPAELRQFTPEAGPGRPVEWYETTAVQEPQLIDGRWCKPLQIIDLRTPENLELLRLKLRAMLSDLRFAHETGGVDVAGAMIKTDRESQATITGAYARASTDPTTTVQWKADNGFVSLDAAAIMMFGTAVFNHVQGCFAREKVLLEQIDAAENIDALMAVKISEGW